jgi:hypothetical protein
MTQFKRRVTGLMAAGLLAAAISPAAAIAGGSTCYPPPPQKQHCNAGRGNGSEGCDPGNSSTSSNGSTGQNQGGDEGGPIHGGTGAP